MEADGVKLVRCEVGDTPGGNMAFCELSREEQQARTAHMWLPHLMRELHRAALVALLKYPEIATPQMTAEAARTALYGLWDSDQFYK